MRHVPTMSPPRLALQSKAARAKPGPGEQRPSADPRATADPLDVLACR